MKAPLLVCGHGRCGSSLVMKMLQAGGYPVYGEAPAFEPDDVGFDRTMRTLLPRLIGKAAKILDPQLSDWPPTFDARIIWLDRDPKQQAKSQVKFVRTLNPGISIPGGAWRAMAASLKPDTAKALAIFERAGCPVLRLRFEEIITRPAHTALRLSDFVASDFDATAAHSVVIKRPTNCAPDLAIEMAGMAEVQV